MWDFSKLLRLKKSEQQLLWDNIQLQGRIERLERELGIGQPTREERLEALTQRYLYFHRQGLEIQQMSDISHSEIVARAKEINDREKQNITSAMMLELLYEERPNRFFC